MVALGIGAASFASETLVERAKIERKARRRSRNAQIKFIVESVECMVKIVLRMSEKAQSSRLVAHSKKMP